MERPRKVLVGVDFTSCSASAVHHAVRIAQANHAGRHALHVLEPLVVTALAEQLGGRAEPTVARLLIEDARHRWKELASGIPGAETIELDVDIDDPVAAVLRRTVVCSADILVLGRNGTSLDQGAMGSVASTCLKKATSDVMVVSASHRGPFRRVVACVDLSHSPRPVLERAARIAENDAAELHILHVFQGPWNRLHYRAPTPQAAPDFQKQYRDALQRCVWDLCQPLLEGMGAPSATYWLIDHAAGSAGIGEAVERLEADLVVIGARRRAYLRDWLTSQTAECVARRTTAALLAVRTEATRQALFPIDVAGKIPA